MAKVAYKSFNFRKARLEMIKAADQICQHYYNDLGMVITLRQLHYRFVSLNLYPNTQKSYNQLQSAVNDGRYAGLIDWDHLIDRTRGEFRHAHWDNPGVLIESGARQYRADLWASQSIKPLVFIEKDAAIGVIERVCNDNDVPYLSCRGYASSSEIWAAAQRIRAEIENGFRVFVYYIGDHDPSGLDMTRDLRERLARFIYNDWRNLHAPFLPLDASNIKRNMRTYLRDRGKTIGDEQVVWGLKRIAINMDQIEQYQPEPNFAKTTDSRYDEYVTQTGMTDSWELDALEPEVLQQLIQDEIDNIRDQSTWDAAVSNQEQQRRVLEGIAKFWTPVNKFVSGLQLEDIQKRFNNG